MIALNFIAKTQDQADAMIAQYGKYFDGVEYEVGVITENFSEVRNRVLQTTRDKKYDYLVWWDTDDVAVGLEKLPALVAQMAERGIDALYAPYEYAYNEQGECIVLQWRERIIRVAHPFEWMGAIHESLISVTAPLLDRTEDLVIQHHKTIAEHTESATRNHKILLAEYKKPDRDPRITHYLALSFFNKGVYKRAIALFQEHIKTSGWDEDQYRSWFYTGQAYGLLNDNSMVLWAATEGVKLIPGRPECYVLAASAEFEQRNFAKCVEWLKSSSTKEPPRNSLSAIDPTYYSYKAEFLAAQAYLNLGSVKEAYEQLKLVLQHSPNFEPARQIAPLFQEIYDDQAAISKITWLADYFGAYNGKPIKIFEGMPAKLMSDPRLNAIRSKIYPPVKWPEKSLAIFCGQTLEQWGPESIKTGLGGSEEALVYLSRELSKLGWSIVIYCDREEETRDGTTLYRPWTLFNPQDSFDVICAWRNPGLFSTLPIKARKKIVDYHDMPVGHQELVQSMVDTVDKFFFKSKFQSEQLILPPGKKVVISNGIVTQQFDHKTKRRHHSVGYFSSYDRGLETLLRLWPQVRKEVPDATLDIYYGWDAFDGFHKSNPEMMKWKYQMLRKLHGLKDQGVTENGRVSHHDLARAMQSLEVWAYPTEFPEINCITALKAGKAGLIPVTSGYAALQETILEPQPDYGDFWANNEALATDFVHRLVTALEDGRPEGERTAKSVLYKKFGWEHIAATWDSELA